MNKISYKKSIGIICVTVVGCLIMGYTELFLRPGYIIKSLIKIAAFILPTLCCSLFCRGLNLTRVFKSNFKSRSLLAPVLFGVCVYIAIITAYYIVRPFFDFSNVTAVLSEDAGITSKNFILVSLYISFVNSLLEEYFFRGFAFLTLKQYSGRCFAYLFSAGMFAIYHIAIITSWFSVPLFVLLLCGLLAAGLLFDFVNEKYGNIYSSWAIHMCANFAVNTVGCMLFGIF